MIRKFLLVVLLGPVIELAVAVLVASRIGVLYTVLLIVATSVLGMVLVRSEGIAALRGVQRDLRRGLPPGLGLMNGVLRVFGAILLAIPGIVTSVIGLLLLIPPFRVLVAPFVVARLAARASASVRVIGLDGLMGNRSYPGGGTSFDGRRHDPTGEVIDAEGWEVDDRPVHELEAPDGEDPGRLGSNP